MDDENDIPTDNNMPTDKIARDNIVTDKAPDREVQTSTDTSSEFRPACRPASIREISPVVWHFSVSIDGKRDCLIALFIFNLCSFFSVTCMGIYGQIFGMLLISILFIRYSRRPLNIPANGMCNVLNIP